MRLFKVVLGSVAAIAIAFIVNVVTIAVGMNAERRADAKPPTVELRRGMLFYDSQITNEGAKRLIALYEAQDVKPDLLGIRSAGGDIDAGMEIGEFVHRNQLSVHILDFCVSSCANYVFTAGKQKVLSSGALVA